MSTDFEDLDLVLQDAWKVMDKHAENALSNLFSSYEKYTANIKYEEDLLNQIV